MTDIASAFARNRVPYHGVRRDDAAMPGAES